MSELLTKKSDGWYKGCGCGQKIVDKIIVPEGAVEVFMQHNGSLKGPVSGIDYNFLATTTAIDVDPADAQAWKEQGLARDPIPGWKGRQSRLTV